MCNRRGVRADIGRANEDDGMVTGGGLLVWVESDFWLSLEQLLALDGFERGDAGRECSAGPAVEVLVVEMVEVVVFIDSEEAFDVSAGFSGRLNLVFTPAD